MSLQVSLIIDNDLSDLDQLTKVANKFLAEAKVSDRAVYAVNLVIEETVTNIIKYGYDDTDNHKIAVNLQPDSEHMVVSIEDDGHEFDPLQAPEPDTQSPLEQRRIGGLGIHLVRNVVDKIEYRRENDKNILEMSIGSDA